ncbi:hypothetical protein [Burkholderia ubonensis]|uniref:hypothetical protein n=1 Tax=Burkholderia ubonensis TaxID=101571 RepID=UPI000B17B483|nr:hypothetical protein [Burkholderia ubonensis]
MNRKVIWDRVYVAISNACLISVVGIAIFYDRLPAGSKIREQLFWLAIVIGAVSFSAYIVRQVLASRAKSCEVAVETRDEQPVVAVVEPTDSTSGIRDKTDASDYAQVVLLEQDAESWSSVGTGSGSEYVRVVEAMETLGAMNTVQLFQLYRNTTTLAGFTIQIEVQRARKPNPRYGKQHTGMLGSLPGKVAISC